MAVINTNTSGTLRINVVLSNIRKKHFCILSQFSNFVQFVHKNKLSSFLCHKNLRSKKIYRGTKNLQISRIKESIIKFSQMC